MLPAVEGGTPVAEVGILGVGSPAVGVGSPGAGSLVEAGSPAAVDNPGN